MAALLTSSHSPIPVLEPSEVLWAAIESGQAELTLTIPDAPPQGSAASGGSGGARNWKELGGVWLTNQRFIFHAVPSLEPLLLSVPLRSMLSTKFEQPYLFGSNFLAFEVQPAAFGGLTNGTHAELRFKDLPMFDFVSKLENARKAAILLHMRRQADEEALPVYTPAQENSSAVYNAGVPTDDPPGYDV